YCVRRLTLLQAVRYGTGFGDPSLAANRRSPFCRGRCAAQGAEGVQAARAPDRIVLGAALRARSAPGARGAPRSRTNVGSCRRAAAAGRHGVRPPVLVEAMIPAPRAL